MNTATLAVKGGRHLASNRLKLNLALIVLSMAAMLSGALLASVSGNVIDAKMLASSFLAVVLLVALPWQALVALRSKKAISTRQVFLWTATLFVPSGVLLL
ncbi:MAG: hypothetical protein K2W95_17370 [Candidatus Obscuribacterales bacterium]|nr:hypothetical protein [Candidatus Obscuribacterales bacterium]